jgi:hypothetical protein
MKSKIFGMSLTFILLAAVMAAAGDQVVMWVTSGDLNYDDSLEYLLKAGTNPVIIRGVPYEVYANGIQQAKTVAVYGGGIEVYEMSPDRVNKIFGYRKGSSVFGRWEFNLYFDKGIPQNYAALIKNPEYQTYGSQSDQTKSTPAPAATPQTDASRSDDKDYRWRRRVINK